MESNSQRAAPAAAPGTSHPFTCNTCQVAFRTSDLQRTHMQSDWHRYNLKRRVASLPPLTSEIFTEKVLANKASAAATAARASFEKVCPACSKTYYSENAYQNHLGSQKHKAQVARLHARQSIVDDGETGSMVSSTFSLGEPLDTESTISASEHNEVAALAESLSKPTFPQEGAHEAGAVMAATKTEHESSSSIADEDIQESQDQNDPALLTRCLFCNITSQNIEHNVKHMSKQHGMFIPECDYLVDLEGLLHHLREMIFEFNECLYCHQVKHTAVGAQTHMRDRGHCMIAYDTEEEMLEIGEFYDFRSTYSDAEDSDLDDAVREKVNRVKLGASRATKVTIDNGSSADDEVLVDEDEDGWESDASSLSSVPTDEITSIPIDDHSHRYKTLDKHRHHSHNDPRPHRNLDGYHSHAHTTPRAVYHDEYELHLPSGRTAGHRSLNKYYRQNLNGRQTLADRQQRLAIEDAHDSDEEDGAAIPDNNRDRGRQLVSRAHREQGMVGVTDAKRREVQAVEKRMQKKEMRAQKRYEWGNNKRSNHQKHYRDPLLQ